jgi:hypothetical protein
VLNSQLNRDDGHDLKAIPVDMIPIGIKGEDLAGASGGRIRKTRCVTELSDVRRDRPRR